MRGNFTEKGGRGSKNTTQPKSSCQSGKCVFIMPTEISFSPFLLNVFPAKMVARKAGKRTKQSGKKLVVTKQVVFCRRVQKTDGVVGGWLGGQVAVAAAGTP